MKTRRLALALGLCLACVGALAQDEERPPEFEDLPAPPPPWKVPEYPILALATTCRPPQIDGAIDTREEWKDAAILSGFFQKDLNAVAPPQAQMLFLIKTDAEHLYLGMQSPVFPPGSALRSFEKQPDALDGIMAGDHMAVELLPAKVRQERLIRSTGFFAFVWNPLGTLADLHVAYRPGMLGAEWISQARLATVVTGDVWSTELAVPLDRLANEGMAKYVEFPPAEGQYWSLGFARRFGRVASNLFTTWVNEPLVFQRDYGAQMTAWARQGMLRFQERCLAVHLLSLGDLTRNEVDVALECYNPDTAAHTVTAHACVEDKDGKKVWSQEVAVEVPAGQTARVPPLKTALKLEYPRGNFFYLKVLQEGEKILYITPAMALLCFDDSLRAQYNRSLEMLRQD